MDSPVKDNNVKFDIKAQQADFVGFINAVKSAPQVSQTAYTPADEKNHFVIYKFADGGDKCVVVYDTKAEKISLTALPDVLERFKQIYIKRDSILNGLQSAGRVDGKNLPAKSGNVQKLPSKRADKVNKLPANQPSKQIAKQEKQPPQQQKQQEKNQKLRRNPDGRNRK